MVLSPLLYGSCPDYRHGLLPHVDAPYSGWHQSYLTGKRTEGSIYGTFSLSRRIGTTIGSSLGVLMLGWTGYQVGAATQSAAALGGIKMLALLVPALFVLGSWAAFKFVWNIDDATREKIAAAKTANQQ